jgi:hypothetical protein
MKWQNRNDDGLPREVEPRKGAWPPRGLYALLRGIGGLNRKKRKERKDKTTMGTAKYTNHAKFSAAIRRKGRKKKQRQGIRFCVFFMNFSV